MDRMTTQLFALTAVVVIADLLAIVLWLRGVLTIFESLAIVLALAFSIAPRWQRWRRRSNP